MNEVSQKDEPKLSVILASQNARKAVVESLSALADQAENYKIEIIVADNSTDGTQEIIRQKFPNIKIIEAAKNELIPQLWKIGVDASSSEFVALSTTHFVPADNWISMILKFHELSSYGGIGGAIEIAEGVGIVSQAIYFCRYTDFMLPFEEERIADFAADNSSYKRRDLERVQSAMTEGFWEAFVHREMLKEYIPLLLTPEIVAYHHESFTFKNFVWQRFLHGIEFGKARAESISQTKRLILILASPLIPFVYLFRIGRNIWTKKRNIAKFIRTLPILTVFLISWSIGELFGYLRGGK